MTTLCINGDTFDAPFADLLPPLTDEERAGLRADIAQNGVLQPVIFTRHHGRFVVIDGHNRAGIAAELGLRVPVCEKKYASFEAMKAHALELNLHRRHLTREQRRELVAAVLKADPEQSNSAVAAKAGVTDKTVGAVRAEMESTSEIPRLTATKGRDGRTRPAKPTRKPKPAPAPEQALPEPDEAFPFGANNPADPDCLFGSGDVPPSPAAVEWIAEQDGVGWGTPLPDGVSEWVDRFQLLGTLIAQAHNVERVREYLDGAREMVRECERNLLSAGTGSGSNF